MKKQIKKLKINKRTISNLSFADMAARVGAGATNGNQCTQKTCNYTCAGDTCGGPPFTKRCNSF
jgi:hypothetical protein